MTEAIQAVTLFVDLRGSTSLFVQLGNTMAAQLVTENINQLGDLVQERGGEVVKTLGDGLMAIFRNVENAVSVSEDMLALYSPHHCAAQHHAPDHRRINDPNRAGMKLKLALSYGELVSLNQDYYGDAVNVAARMLDIAGDNEILVTAELLAQIPEDERGGFRSLNMVQLRGRQNPVHVFRRDIAKPFANTIATTYQSMFTDEMSEALRLSWLDEVRIISSTQSGAVIGRGADATLCVEDTRVSRMHARVDYHNGHFHLTDLSYNGTFIRFAGDSQVLHLRRTSCVLHGEGNIHLGSQATDPTSAAVHFELVTFSDTEPHRPP